MRILFLGTGTSTGVPVIGCKCKVCSSNEPRNKRLRQSVYITEGEFSILIDATIDLRQQCLRHNISRIDAILITHAHADHILGLDETRVFSYAQNRYLRVYGSKNTLSGIKKSLWYCFEEGIPFGGGIPQFELIEVKNNFTEGPFQITSLKGDHGFQEVTGYKIDKFCYLTDCKYVPEETIKIAKDCDILAINALRENKPHPTHMTVEEAISVIRKINPKKSYLIHLGHSIDFHTLSKKLPSDIELSYDGLIIELERS